MNKYTYFLIILLLMECDLIGQYVGIGGLFESDQVQVFYMDYNGNINLGNRLNANRGPWKIAISTNGLVVVGHIAYFPPNLVTLTILKIDENGNVTKIRDIDLGGKCYDINITPDQKYILVNHQIDLPDNNYDHGISVLEITENDLIMPPKNFLSLHNLNISFVNFDVNQQGVLLGISQNPLYILNLDENGNLTYTNNYINLQNVSASDVEFSPDGKRFYMTTWKGISVVDVDENKNVSLWGYVDTDGSQPVEISVTPNSNLILETIVFSNIVAVFKNNDNQNVEYKDKINTQTLPQPIDITHDGKYSVVGSGYIPGQCTLSVLKINPDDSVIYLQDKDVIAPYDMHYFALYQLPPTFVETNWQFYK